ncbi:MAG: Holliday junction resolvase RuvX [Gemmatimonadetes bacterium]|nr:Holliday junction resolvase RuvX [Gemmatimonadota bacterium]
MAVDYGERRVGLAVSDPLRVIASPAGHILRRAGKRPPIAEIMRRAEALEAGEFVLGLPLDGEGDETDRSREVRHIAAELEKRTGYRVRLIDERFSTAAALRAIREMGGSTRGRKGDVDALAAAILLQQALGMSPEMPSELPFGVPSERSATEGNDDGDGSGGG